MNMPETLHDYELYLIREGYADRTVESYLHVALVYQETYSTVDEISLHSYRDDLMRACKPGTVNQRIHALNRYLRHLGREDLLLHGVRMQPGTFAEHTITDADYKLLLSALLSGGHLRDYHAVRLMATTGMRVSELLGTEVAHIERGYLDVHSKGKARRIHIPDATCEEAASWLAGEGRSCGRLLLNRYGEPISSRGLACQLKARAVECGLDAATVHPHAFRHLFARKFLEAGGDIAFLADLLGHSSVETTRTYLRRTSAEQHDALNKLVDW